MKHPTSGINLKTWEEFVERIQRVPNTYLGIEQDIPLSFVYRGQPNSMWKLETTLERYKKTPKTTLHEYYRDIRNCAPEIETLTGTRWDLIEDDKYQDWLRNEANTEWPFARLPCYDFMAYLRHHGFPSPLLDWSKSPFVAAYFAFANVNEDVDFVSVFAYCERPIGFKISGSDKPIIRQMGSYIRTHKRHFQQQSEYTICIGFEGESLSYESHEEVFATEQDDQDVLVKFNIPASERIKVLRYLDLYNLNAFSLFSSEDSLCQTMALRRYKLHE